MKILVILGSTRPGRVGERVAKWALNGFASHPDIDAELLDLADYNLPHFDEAIPPRANTSRRPSPNVARYLKKIAAADGYIIVTPEYNYSFPGILKDALDFVDYQMHRKPVAIVSYGVNGGTRASVHLQTVIHGVKAAVVPEAVTLTGPQNYIDESGNFTGDASAPFGPEKKLEIMISELKWWVNKTAADKIPV
jgi:NAD(P)H-dependent FMN reductase